MQDFGWPLISALLSVCDPTHDTKNKFSLWILKIYAEKLDNHQPFKSEDLYKIRDQLRYFETASAHIIKNAPRLPDGTINNRAADITFYKNYEQFSTLIDPLMIAQHTKREKHGLSAEIRAETTFLYEGPAGAIVVPHTMRASQFWGQGTTWCIAAREAEENAFEDYNKKGPILIFIPRVPDAMRTQFPKYRSFRFAVVNNEIYDELDNSKNVPRDPLKPLLAESCAPTNPDTSYLLQYTQCLNPEDLKPKAETPLQPEESRPKEPQTNQFTPAEQDILLQLKTGFRILKNYHDLCERHDFMLAAVQQDGRALEYASADLRADREIVLAAVQENGYALEYASADLRADREIVLAAVQQDGYVLQYVSDDLRADRDIVLAAVQQKGRVLLVINKKFFSDPEFTLKVLEIARDTNTHNKEEILKYLHRFEAFFGGPLTCDINRAIAHVAGLRGQKNLSVPKIVAWAGPV
jgi:hypothetical protein